MNDIILTINGILTIISLLLLFIFCAYKTKYNVASYFYISTGIFAAIEFILSKNQFDNVQFIVAMIMSSAFIIIGLYLIYKRHKLKGTLEEKEFNNKFRTISHKGGNRRLIKVLSKLRIK